MIDLKGQKICFDWAICLPLLVYQILKKKKLQDQSHSNFHTEHFQSKQNWQTLWTLKFDVFLKYWTLICPLYKFHLWNQHLITPLSVTYVCVCVWQSPPQQQLRRSCLQLVGKQVGRAVGTGGDRPRHPPTKCEWNQDGQIKVNIIEDRDGFDMKCHDEYMPRLEMFLLRG